MMIGDAGMLVGRRVRIVSWTHGEFVAAFLERTNLPAAREGTIKHVSASAGGDVWVQVDGLKREYAFGLDQLELLPQAPTGPGTVPP